RSRVASRAERQARADGHDDRLVRASRVRQRAADGANQKISGGDGGGEDQHIGRRQHLLLLRGTAPLLLDLVVVDLVPWLWTRLYDTTLQSRPPADGQERRRSRGFAADPLKEPQRLGMVLHALDVDGHLRGVGECLRVGG